MITLAGLTPAAISCFGSSWNRTPAIDNLAADGVCWDRVVCHTTESNQIWLNWFQQTVTADTDSRHIVITDDIDLARLVRDGDFASRCEVIEQPIRSATDASPAESIDQSHVASLFRTATDRLNVDTPAATVWLHSRFLLDCWDAPRELFPIDDVIEDDFDEPGDEVGDAIDAEAEPACLSIFDTVIPPTHKITKSDDIDLAMAWMRTYGCQVRLIDHLLDDLIEVCEQADVPIILAGTSGFALGQNGFIGHAAGPIRSCHIGVPVVTNRGGPLRIRQVMGTDQFAPAIVEIGSNRDDWLKPQTWATTNQTTSTGDEIQPLITTATDQAKQCVHTADWFYVRDLNDDDALFLKPDDLHDANNVKRLKPGVVDAFRELG